MSESIRQIGALQMTAQYIQDEIKRLPQLRNRLSAQSQRDFSLDLALVGHRLRTGYLVDLVVPQDPVETFSRLVWALRTNQCTRALFISVSHILEPSSEQSFFVNIKLLPSRAPPSLRLVDIDPSLCIPMPLFLRLETQIEMLENTPNSLRPIIDVLLSLMTLEPSPISFSLPTGISIEDAVPLAAVLLDYPIAYVPSLSSSNSGLSGIPLDLYECILTFASKDGKTESDVKDTHTIMKFSCPAPMADRNPDRCQPRKLIAQLEKMFATRMGLIGGPKGLVVDVIHSTRTLDHITF